MATTTTLTHEDDDNNKEEEEEEDIITNSLKTLLTNGEQDNNNNVKTTPSNETNRHYLKSTESTVVIRQLPSQGLSFQLWPAATTLVNLLDHHRKQPQTSPLGPTFSNLPNNLKVLELGSGTGLVGISAAITLGADVTVTDLPHVIPNLQFNAEENSGVVKAHGGSVHVAALRWGEEEDVEMIGREFDVIMASDVVYHDHLYEPLIKTLRLLCDDGKKERVFVMAHLRRWKKESVFFKKVKKFFEVDVLFKDKPCNGARNGVVVYRFGKRG